MSQSFAEQPIDPSAADSFNTRNPKTVPVVSTSYALLNEAERAQRRLYMEHFRGLSCDPVFEAKKQLFESQPQVSVTKQNGVVVQTGRPLLRDCQAGDRELPVPSPVVLPVQAKEAAAAQLVLAKPKEQLFAFKY